MAIFLVQHGRCLPKEVDPQQGLSEEGAVEVERIAKIAKEKEIPVSRIVHSGKKRAKQTAEIFSNSLCPPQGVLTMEGMRPMDDVKNLAARLDKSSNMMFVGHLPFMEKLVSFLVAGTENICVYKFQNGGIVCLDYTTENSWFLRWSLQPDLTVQTESGTGFA